MHGNQGVSNEAREECDNDTQHNRTADMNWAKIDEMRISYTSESEMVFHMETVLSLNVILVGEREFEGVDHVFMSHL
jgi:hypothetical protein